MVAQGWIGAVYGLNYEQITDHTGLRNPGSEPLTGAKYQYYRTSDGLFVLFCCIEPEFWERFCRTAERDDLVDRHVEEGAVDFARDAHELRRGSQTVIGTRMQRECRRWRGACASTTASPSRTPRCGGSASR